MLCYSFNILDSLSEYNIFSIHPPESFEENNLCFSRQCKEPQKLLKKVAQWISAKRELKILEPIHKEPQLFKNRDLIITILHVRSKNIWKNLHLSFISLERSETSSNQLT